MRPLVIELVHEGTLAPFRSPPEVGVPMMAFASSTGSRSQIFRESMLVVPVVSGVGKLRRGA